jgi:hypothetical protein
MSVLASLVIVPSIAYAAQLPVLGTDAESISQYDATVEDAGRPLHWNLNFMKYNKPLNTTLLNNLAARDVTHIVVTLELQDKLADIANGTLDTDLKAASDQMSLWHQAHPNIQMIVRPFHEMNGSWYPWGFEGGHNGNSVSQFVPAWKHVRRVMRDEFPELAFMWCPNILFYSDDDYSLYYPGNDQAEYLGLDGYNHSSSQGTWTTIQNVFQKSLIAIRSIPGIDPNKPLVIAETGTTEPDANSAAAGHSKAEWFSNSYGNMGWWLHNEAPQFGVAAVLYFDYPDLYTGKRSITDKNDYLIHDKSLPNAFESRAAFRESVFDLP